MAYDRRRSITAGIKTLWTLTREQSGIVYDFPPTVTDELWSSVYQTLTTLNWLMHITFPIFCVHCNIHANLTAGKYCVNTWNSITFNYFYIPGLKINSGRKSLKRYLDWSQNEKQLLWIISIGLLPSPTDPVELVWSGYQQAGSEPHCQYMYSIMSCQYSE